MLKDDKVEFEMLRIEIIVDPYRVYKWCMVGIKSGSTRFILLLKTNHFALKP